MKYFTDCKTLDELKKEYRRLAMKYHPDRGGDTATMQQINNAYAEMFEILKKAHNTTNDAQHQCTEAPEEFIEIISALLKLDGLEVELCGRWLWIGGETKKHKEALKAAGCRWSKNKGLWYWRHEEDARPHRGHGQTMSAIRFKYGSQVFDRAGDETSNYVRIGATA